MNDEELATIRARCEVAAPGPLREDITALLAEIERLHHRNNTIAQSLRGASAIILRLAQTTQAEFPKMAESLRGLAERFDKLSAELVAG
jgi:hypothetical protein